MTSIQCVYHLEKKLPLATTTTINNEEFKGRIKAKRPSKNSVTSISGYYLHYKLRFTQNIYGLCNKLANKRTSNYIQCCLVREEKMRNHSGNDTKQLFMDSEFKTET